MINFSRLKNGRQNEGQFQFFVNIWFQDNNILCKTMRPRNCKAVCLFVLAITSSNCGCHPAHYETFLSHMFCITYLQSRTKYLEQSKEIN